MSFSYRGHDASLCRAALLLTLAILTVSLTTGAQAQSTRVRRQVSDGFTFTAGWGWNYVGGQINPPSGTLQVTTMTPKGSPSGTPSTFAFIDLAVFPTPTTAVEFMSLGDAVGKVTIPSSSFSTPASIDITIPGFLYYHEWEPIFGFYNLVDVKPAVARVKSTLSKPTNIENIRDRTIRTHTEGLAGQSFRYASDFRGRFGYNATGTASVTVDAGGSSMVFVPAGTPVVPEENVLGFVTSGTVSAMR